MAIDPTLTGLPEDVLIDGSEVIELLNADGRKAVRLMDSGLGGVRVPLHSRFGWDSTRYPINIYRDRRGVYSTDFEPKTALASMRAIFEGVAAGTTNVFYADIARADDTGSGATMALAKKTPAACLRLTEADATKAATIIYGNKGWYPAKWSLMTNGAGATAIPTKPFVFIAVGGPVFMTMAMETSNWAIDTADATNRTYKWQRANTRWLFDRLASDRLGRPVKIRRVASPAAVYASTDIDGTVYHLAADNTIYLRRADARVPTVDNTAVILLGDVLRSNLTGVHMYASGTHFIGGQAGTVQANSTAGAEIDVVLEDCSFMAGGWDYESPSATPAAQSNCVAYDAQGIVVVNRCTGSMMPGDNINVHGFRVTSPSARAHALVLNCQGWDVGGPLLNSSNHLTTHGNDVLDPGGGGFEYGTRMLAINFAGESSGGGMVGFSGGHIAMFGGTLDGDRGAMLTGTSQAIGLGGSTARFFGYEVTTKRCEVGLGVEEGAIAYITGMRFGGGGIRLSGNGQVVNF